VQLVLGRPAHSSWAWSRDLGISWFSSRNDPICHVTLGSRKIVSTQKDTATRNCSRQTRFRSRCAVGRRLALPLATAFTGLFAAQQKRLTRLHASPDQRSTGHIRVTLEAGAAVGQGRAAGIVFLLARLADRHWRSGATVNHGLTGLAPFTANVRFTQAGAVGAWHEFHAGPHRERRPGVVAGIQLAH